jgi:hypothetical protein
MGAKWSTPGSTMSSTRVPCILGRPRVADALADRHPVVGIAVHQQLRDAEGQASEGGRESGPFRISVDWPAQKARHSSSPEALTISFDQVAYSSHRDGGGHRDLRIGAGRPWREAGPGGSPQRQLPAGRVPKGYDPLGVDQLGQGVDAGRDVEQRVGPGASRGTSPVLQVPRGVAAGGQIIGRLVHEVPGEDVSPEPTMHEYHHRVWTASDG